MKKMILAGTLTFAGLAGVAAFVSKTKATAATIQEQNFTKYYF
ncbi:MULTISPECIES: hypothetical protein [unclassified Bacillus (in: firmicutes)]|nr:MULTISPECIES: hypothetical protein [unclassified Bacillus (in: firmicutes)]